MEKKLVYTTKLLIHFVKIWVVNRLHKRGTYTVVYKCYTHIWDYLKGRPKVKHKMKLKIRSAVMTPESFRNFNSADFGSATSFVTVDPNCISIDFNKQQQSRFEWLVIVCCALLLRLSLAFRVNNSWTGNLLPSPTCTSSQQY